MGPERLRSDPVDYAQALGSARKRQLLSMIVGLRYADTPAFLATSQIIAAYTVDATATAALNSRPDPGGPAAGLSGMSGFSSRPTFTFVPITGPEFSNAFIRPLPAASVLPLSNGGIPIDLVMRMTVQSIAGLQNATMLGESSGAGSPGFFELMKVLRRLQLDGAVAFRVQERADGAQVLLTLNPPMSDAPPGVQQDLASVRRLLRLPGARQEYALADASGSDTIGLATRSVLAVLSALAAQIDVPPVDITNGKTKQAIDLVGGESRPVVVVRAGSRAPHDAFASIAERGGAFWIDSRDFDSKYAMTVLEYLLALSEVKDTSHTPLVTIPAN